MLYIHLDFFSEGAANRRVEELCDIMTRTPQLLITKMSLESIIFMSYLQQKNEQRSSAHRARYLPDQKGCKQDWDYGIRHNTHIRWNENVL